jgi:hypothetical protein
MALLPVGGVGRLGNQACQSLPPLAVSERMPSWHEKRGSEDVLDKVLERSHIRTRKIWKLYPHRDGVLKS